MLQVVKLIHVTSLIIWLGALCVLIQLITSKSRSNLMSADSLKELCRKIYLRVDLPFLLLAISSGIVLFIFRDCNTKAAWFHMKMSGMLLLVFSDIWAARLIGIFTKKPMRRSSMLLPVYIVSLVLALSAIYVIRNKEAEWKEKYAKELVEK